jgi:hypothetical protein
MVGFGGILLSREAISTPQTSRYTASSEIFVDIGAWFAYKEALDQKVLRT